MFAGSNFRNRLKTIDRKDRGEVSSRRPRRHIYKAKVTAESRSLMSQLCPPKDFGGAQALPQMMVITGS